MRALARPVAPRWAAQILHATSCCSPRMSQTRHFISAKDARPPFFVGVDVGGTNIKIGVVDDSDGQFRLSMGLD